MSFLFTMFISTQVKSFRNSHSDLLTWWAYQVASVCQVVNPAESAPTSVNFLVPDRLYLREVVFCAVALCFIALETEQTNAVSSRELDLLLILVVCTNCSSEIAVSTGDTSSGSGAQRNMQLSLSHLSHLNIPDCICVWHPWRTSHLNPYFCSSFLPPVCKDTVVEFNICYVQRITYF